MEDGPHNDPASAQPIALPAPRRRGAVDDQAHPRPPERQAAGLLRSLARRTGRGRFAGAVMPNNRPQVVIVGAGFGGLEAAKRLAHQDVDVTVIDRRNHHLFQPLLYQVATAALSPADIAAPIRSILASAPNVRVLLDNVSGVIPGANQVCLESGRRLPYDWLIIATGAQHSYFGRDDWARYAPGIKTIEDATAVRRSVLLALERAETETNRTARNALLTF